MACERRWRAGRGHDCAIKTYSASYHMMLRYIDDGKYESLVTAVTAGLILQAQMLSLSEDALECSYMRAVFSMMKWRVCLFRESRLSLVMKLSVIHFSPSPSSNNKLFWFYPLALMCFSQCMLHVLTTCYVFGAISLFMIIDLCTFVKLFLV